MDDRLKNVTDETLRERGFVYEIASSDFITRFPQEMKETRRIWLEKDASIRYAPLSENAVTAQYHPDYRDMTGKARRRWNTTMRFRAAGLSLILRCWAWETSW